MVAWVPTLELVCAAVAYGLWYARGGWVVTSVGSTAAPWWPILLPLVALWVLRAGWLWHNRAPDGAPAFPRTAARTTPLLIPLCLFLLTAALNVTVAYNPVAAQIKAGELLTALGLAWALAHGCVDDVVLGSRAIGLLLVPFGVLGAVGRITRAPPGDEQDGVSRFPKPHGAAVVVVALTVLLIGGIIGFLATDRGRGGTSGPNRWAATWVAAWHANRGVVTQAKAELGRYDAVGFSDASIEDVRRTLDLTDVEAYFVRALTLDPRNATACQRLASISLAHRDYDRALALMQQAWDAGHRDRVTRLLYSDSLVAAGRIDEAVRIAAGLTFAHARMLEQAWDRYQRHGNEARAADAYAAAARLGP